MAENKKFKELTIKNNFMFGAVMCESNNCKELLKLAAKAESIEQFLKDM